MTKTVRIATINFEDGLKELSSDLRAIDPEIMVTGTAALSGVHYFVKSKVVELVIDGIAGAVKALVLAAVANWAKKLFGRRKDVEIVKIYAANNRDVLLLVERDKNAASPLADD